MDGGNHSGHEALGASLAMTEGGDNGKSERQRHTYVSMRLAEIADRIRDFAAEREQITAGLKTRAAEKGDEVRRLRQRREYLAARLANLREEQQNLNLEKRALAPVAGSSAPRGKTGKAKVAAAV